MRSLPNAPYHQIDALVTEQRVVTGAADEDVGSDAAVEGVGADTTVEHGPTGGDESWSSPEPPTAFSTLVSVSLLAGSDGAAGLAGPEVEQQVGAEPVGAADRVLAGATVDASSPAPGSRVSSPFPP